MLLLWSFATFPFYLQAQWTKTNGLPGGNTSQLLNFGDTVLANIGAELYFSVNHGKTWTPIIHPDYNGIRVYASNGLNILGYAYDRNEQAGIVYRTDDFFQSLHKVDLDTFSLHDFFIANGYIYGSFYENLNSKLYRTKDDGVTWEYVSATSLTEVNIDGQLITGADYPYILQSGDGGFTWDTLLQISSNVSGIIKDENRLLVLLAYPTPGCYNSADYGQTWQYYPNIALYNYFRYIWHQGVLYGLDGNKAIQSTNFGQTWAPVMLPLHSAYPANYGVSSGNAIIIGGYHSLKSPGLHRSIDNGLTWNPVSFGITAASGKLRPINHDMFVPSSGGLYKVKPDRVNWSKMNLNISLTPNATQYITDFIQPGNNWLVSISATPWVSQNGGLTWSKSEVPTQAPFGLPAEISDFEIVGDKVLAGGLFEGDFYQYFISEDKGVSFHSLNSLTQQFQTNILSLDVSNGKAYALASNKYIYRSDDACENWIVHAGPIPTDSLNGSELYQSLFRVRNNVMAITSYYSNKKMLFSTDSGQSWNFYNKDVSGFPWGNSSLNDLLWVGNKLLIATGNGLFYSESNGMNWTPWSEGMLNNSISDIEALGGFIWASVAGGGIWKRPIGQLGFSEPAIERFVEPGLSSNASLSLSPNPADNHVLIKTEDKGGELYLYDTQGHEVLHQSFLDSSTEIGLGSLPPAIYRVVFRSKKRVEVTLLVVQH